MSVRHPALPFALTSLFGQSPTTVWDPDTWVLVQANALYVRNETTVTAITGGTRRLWTLDGKLER